MINSSDLLRVSLRQIIRQRGYGVILSIALGITAFITLTVLGREIRYTIGQDMMLIGGVNIMQVIAMGTLDTSEPLTEFSPSAIEAVKSLPEVAMLSKRVGGHQSFVFSRGSAKYLIPFVGVDENYWPTFAATLLAGRLLTAEDIKERRRVCVLGWEIAQKMFGSPQKAVGEILTMGADIFEIVGVVGGVMLGGNVVNGFLPYTTMLDRNWAHSKITRLYVRAMGWEDVAKLEKSIPEVVHTHQKAPYLQIRTQVEQLERIQNTFVFVEALLWLGILASLLLGGFGIWYGTFAAVRARTREVGLKKAMGGSDRDILAQFLTEALCKSVAGGILGILIGTICVELGSFMLGSGLSYITLLISSLGSIVFSAVIGIAGGAFPALQASRMDVVSALRFE